MKRFKFNLRPVGANLRLPCTADGAKTIKYSWLKDGAPLKPRRVSNKMNASDAVLKLKDLVLSDIGNYTCTARNRYGSISFNFDVTVLGKCSCCVLNAIWTERRLCISLLPLPPSPFSNILGSCLGFLVLCVSGGGGDRRGDCT